MDEQHRNTMLAILLSVIVLIAWQYFVGIPQMEKQRTELERQKQQQTEELQPDTIPTPGIDSAPRAPGVPADAVPGAATRDAAVAATPRIELRSPRIRGSISLRGARIDDIELLDYRETVDPGSPNIKLLSPSGSPSPFYAEFGWVAAPGTTADLPGPGTVWTVEGPSTLAAGQPVVLVWNNDSGLEFRRTIALDENYMFTLRDEVRNTGAAPVTLFGYGLVSRHGTPQTLGFYILHEGLIGVLGDGKLHEISYGSIAGEPPILLQSEGGWLGITDKYWAATLIPDQSEKFQARFSSGQRGTVPTYQADYLLDAKTVAPGATAQQETHFFAGAKESELIDHYEQSLGIKNFELLIDWGWFYFITKPLFFAMDYFFRLTGNFGVAILIVTVLIKIVFFPLANKSYASMARMKAVQPQMLEIRERFKDDKMKQQQAMMELYKQEKINPLAGCWPILIQIPVFFALYKVLFVTIEMRHAPFFGWIKDLSAPDPTSLFNLFGLIPWDPSVIPLIGPFLMIGVWPLLMGFTMFVQMKMNPPPPDPTQKMLFDWMPVFFTFLLATFPAGLVIYWAWNNFLSVLQQGAIMRKHGVKIELWDNFSGLIGKPGKSKTSGSDKNPKS